MTQSILQMGQQTGEREAERMKTRYFDEAASNADRDISEFHGLFRPFVNQIYRGALVLTASPSGARKLQTEIYLEAFMEYLRSGEVINFKAWLLEIIARCFRQFRDRDSQDDAQRAPIEVAMKRIYGVNRCGDAVPALQISGDHQNS